MIEKKVKLDAPIQDACYRAWFRCTNCGVIFQHDINKGLEVSSMTGVCPECGVKSSPRTGVFTIVKFNPTYDEIPQRHYFR